MPPRGEVPESGICRRAPRGIFQRERSTQARRSRGESPFIESKLELADWLLALRGPLFCEDRGGVNADMGIGTFGDLGEALDWFPAINDSARSSSRSKTPTPAAERSNKEPPATDEDAEGCLNSLALLLTTPALVCIAVALAVENDEANREDPPS